MNQPRLGTNCLNLGTNRLSTNRPWVRNDWIPLTMPREAVCSALSLSVHRLNILNYPHTSIGIANMKPFRKQQHSFFLPVVHLKFPKNYCHMICTLNS